MPETVAANTKLERAMSSMLNAAADALHRLVGQDVKITSLIPHTVETTEFGTNLRADHAYARGLFEGDEEEHALRIVIPARDATALAGLIMMSPPDVIEERRESETLDGEELETFAEVANVLCSSFDGVLKQGGTEERSLRAHDHGVLPAGQGASGILGHEKLIGLPFELAVSEFAPARGWVLIDQQTAEKWNGEALQPMPEQGGEDGIPAAPIQGRLTAYLADPDVISELRQSCRRVGLELDRRSRAEVPNPAEHKEGLVLLDVPTGDTKRFEWCKRLKHYHEDVRVALLIHHPSRSRVLQGFLAKADAIMGWPIRERELSEKLSSLMLVEEDGGGGDED